MRTVLLAFAVLALSAAAPLPFDQQAYVSQRDAEAGAALLGAAGTAFAFCEPCGDTEPTQLYFDYADARYTGYESFFQVHLDGQGVDLAYTFVLLRGTRTLVNAALILGLDASGVSSVVQL